MVSLFHGFLGKHSWSVVSGNNGGDKIMIRSTVKDAVITSFVADALALGVHWVYDGNAIVEKYGRLEKMIAPTLAPYHAGKKKGAFTHYGDQALVLLKTLSEQSKTGTPGFDLSGFKQNWQALFEDYTGYLDSATKQTLNHLKSNPDMHVSGSLSSDLGGAARIAPLALLYAHDGQAFAHAAAVQTAMTHNHPAVILAARFFAAASVMVFDGETPIAALEKTLADMPNDPNFTQWVTAGLESRKQDTAKTISKFGMACAVDGALPSTIHLIAKYEQDPEQALVENIMAGGDSSARGMLAGFILGAYHGLGALPKFWLDDMAAYPVIETYLNPFV